MAYFYLKFFGLKLKALDATLPSERKTFLVSLLCFDLPTRINPLEESALLPNLTLFHKYAILFSYE
jgi:hypothetical protein